MSNCQIGPFRTEVLTPVVRSVKEWPDRPAFCIDDTFFSYNDFGRCVSKIRAEVQSAKPQNAKVGLVINDDLETYASIVALWLEGCCYVPLHPKWPVERCLDIIGQVGMELILDSSDETQYQQYEVIKTESLTYSQDFLDANCETPDDALAYILFTSGSTGKPKGVQLSRGNVAAFMDSFWKTGINLNEEDRCLQCFDLTFDVSVQGYLAALTRGACVYTVPYGQKKYLYVAGLIDEYKLTFGAMAPSMLRYMRPYFSEIDASSLRYCILTAEACPLDLMEELYQFAPNVELYDFYGPTEGTIYVTYYKLSRTSPNKSLNGIVSIGRPLANVSAIIIDEDGNLLPVGEKGELCVAGSQITPGYWKNEEKNASSFFYKTLDGGNEQRFYHTGDLCYRDDEGDIMYSGRLDHQAKIQGFRVEMGEIEYHARGFLSGRNVACLAFENSIGVTEIAMFVESEQFDTSGLLSHMRTKMPSYMIPTKIFFVGTFPLNANDKVDKNALKIMIKS